MIKNRPLTAKQSSFVQYYADPGSETYNNATQSMIKAGYTSHYTNRHVARMMSNDVIKQRIRAYKAKIGAKLEHNRDIAIKQLTENKLALDHIIAEQPMNVQAITARTAVTRELNAISNLHKQTIVNDAKPEPDLEPAEQRATDEACKTYKLHISQGRTGT